MTELKTELKKTKDLYTIRDVTHDYIVTVHGRGQVCLIGKHHPSISLPVDHVHIGYTDAADGVSTCTVHPTSAYLCSPSINEDFCCTQRKEIDQ